MEKRTKITVRQHSKQRPNCLQYTLTVPPKIAQGLNITKEDRDIIVRLEGEKIIIEKINKSVDSQHE